MTNAIRNQSNKSDFYDRRNQHYNDSDGAGQKITRITFCPNPEPRKKYHVPSQNNDQIKLIWFGIALLLLSRLTVPFI